MPVAFQYCCLNCYIIVSIAAVLFPSLNVFWNGKFVRKGAINIYMVTKHRKYTYKNANAFKLTRWKYQHYASECQYIRHSKDTEKLDNAEY